MTVAAALENEIRAFEAMLPRLRNEHGAIWAVVVDADFKGGFKEFGKAAEFVVSHYANRDALIRHTDQHTPNIPFFAVDAQLPVTFGPAAASENDRRREVAIFGHLIPVYIDAVGPPTSSRTIDGPMETNGLIDTGASDVCIDYRLAQQLGLRPINQSTVNVVGGSALATIYLGRLMVPSMNFDEVMPLYALKVRHSTHEVLLGRSFLQNFIVTFDGPAGMFHFSTPANYHPHGAIEDDFAT